MTKLVALVVTVLGFLAVERTFIFRVTATEKGREWVRRTKWLHPNMICYYRVPMGVLSCIFWVTISKEFAALWFAFWMLTDMTDGTVARRCDLGSAKGEWLDPLCDKLLYIPMLLWFAYWKPSPCPEHYHALSWIPVLIFTAIDIVGQFSRAFTKKKAANSFGKAKTTMVCLLMIVMALKGICYDAYMQIPLFNQFNMDFLMWGCVILSFLSFYCKVIPDEWYANSLTFMNFVCGAAAIIKIMGWYDSSDDLKSRATTGFLLIFLGQFFDLLDGRAARKFGSTRGGALFDDIGDGTSFGLAGSAIVYQVVKPLSLGMAIGVAVFYALCVFYRLYRFLRESGSYPKGVFSGMPSPAGALITVAGAVAFVNSPYAVIAATVISGLMMISRIQYQHFGQRLWGRLPNGLKLSLFVTMMVYMTLVFKMGYSLGRAFALFCFVSGLLYATFGLYLKKNENEKSEEV